MMQEIPDVGNTSGINSRNMHEQMLNIKTIKLYLSMCHNKFIFHYYQMINQIQDSIILLMLYCYNYPQ